MTANIKKASCGACLQHLLEGQGAFIRVKSCGDLHHQNCFLNLDEDHIKKINKTTYKIFCPNEDCSKALGKVTIQKNSQKTEQQQILEGLKGKIEVIDLSANSVAGAKGLKYTTYFAVAMTVVAIALVLHTSFIAVGLGIVVAYPIAYLIGKKIDAYLLPKVNSFS